MHNVEVISIVKGSVYHDHKTIPFLPKSLSGFGGTQLPNGDLLLCGGWSQSGHRRISHNSEYLLYKRGSNKWTKVQNMFSERYFHASVFIDGYILTTGGLDSSRKPVLVHEQFSIEEGLEKKKELPIALKGHTATLLGQHKIIICGGMYGCGVSKTISKSNKKLINRNFLSLISSQKLYMFFISETISTNFYLRY